VSGWKTGFLILALTATVAGCMPSQRQLRTEQDLAEMKRRLARNEKSLAAMREDQGRKIGARLEQLARQQADLESNLQAIRVQIQGVDGRMEALSQKESGLEKNLSLAQKDLGMKVSSLGDRLGKLEARVQNIESRPVTPPQPKETPKALYERGLDLIRKKGDYVQGAQVLQDFLKRYPKDGLAVNAAYWIGEALYGEKKYEDAILQFQDVIQKYGHHPKVAAALLKQGLAFHALGDDKNARTILQKEIDTFPKSPETKKAREFLQAWKGKK
jgi:tol-pal system protein YbgF